MSGVEDLQESHAVITVCRNQYESPLKHLPHKTIRDPHNSHAIEVKREQPAQMNIG
jgi:hypothetical protein